MSEPTASGLLVASSGGHLLQLAQLRGHLPELDWRWVSFETPDATALLRGERVIWAHHPTNRNLRNLLRNTALAVKVMRELRPAVVISTGAGVAVPFCWAGRLLGARVVYVESFARLGDRSLTGRLVHPVAHRFYVQWPETARLFRRAEHAGALFETSSAPPAASRPAA